MKKKKIIFIGILAISILSVFVLFQSRLTKRLDSIAFNSNPLIRHFAPTWRSLKKITDIPFFVAGALRPHQLPVYKIRLSKNDHLRLLENLPDFPNQTKPSEHFKDGVKAEFRAGDYTTTDAKIRYRGFTYPHWNAFKKSWQVNLPKDNPLGDQTTLRFFLPEDRGWAQIFLWNAIRKKFGLITLEVKPAWLIVDEKPMGIYALSEGFEETFLEKNKRVKSSVFNDLNEKTRPDDNDLFMPEGIGRWNDRFSLVSSPAEFLPLRYLLYLTADASDAIFRKEIESVLNMDYFLRWTFAAILTGNFHPGNNRENMNLYFNPAIGKFEPISFDANITPLASPIDLSPPHLPSNRLVNRVLSQDDFRVRFEEIVRAYVSNPANLTEDLAIYDTAAAAIIPAIFRDTQKLPTSWRAWRDIQHDRKLFEQNIRALQMMLDEGGLHFHYAKETYPLSQSHESPDQFDSFHAIRASRGELLAAYPQFVAGVESSTVILLPGAHTFSRDVIIPRGLRVIIREGVRLSFAPGVSFISYSPVSAHGTPSTPIIVTALTADAPWGAFALINTEAKNVFQYTHFSNGKDATINGIYFSGMLSAHNADLDFRFGTIKNAGADDGIHVVHGKVLIQNSLFQENNADSIDVDFAGEGSRIASNRFLLSSKKDSNGDAMDLSFSDLSIKDNVVERCSDKGVSVGESSKLLIEHNTIKNCAYGIAVKDRSEAAITNNVFENNDIAIGLYRKKPHFIVGGTATLNDNIFIGNRQNISIDKYSMIK